MPRDLDEHVRIRAILSAIVTGTLGPVAHGCASTPGNGDGGQDGPIGTEVYTCSPPGPEWQTRVTEDPLFVDAGAVDAATDTAPDVTGDAPVDTATDAPEDTAFDWLADELSALDAPCGLARRARLAARDGTRHTAAIARLARRFGHKARTAHVAPAARRPMFEVALESAVEGCVRETYVAAMALWQSRCARDRGVRAVMAPIARDEVRHGQLAWDVARWIEPRLSRADRARVNRARATRALATGVVRSLPIWERR